MMGSHPSVKDRELIKFMMGLAGTTVNSFDRDIATRGEFVSSSQALGLLNQLLTALSHQMLDKSRKLITGPSPKNVCAKAGSRAILLNLVRGGSKLLERMLALTNGSQLLGANAYMAQSVEDSIVVVGDPWVPVIS